MSNDEKATTYYQMNDDLLAIEKARATGMAHVGVKRSRHFGVTGYCANLAIEQGMIGMSMCNVDPCQTVPGARG